MKDRKDIESNGRKSTKYRGSKCLNCGQPLDKSDVYCPYCSQLNSNKQLSVKDFFAEFLSSILVYDSRLRNTIKDLLFRPGVMTRNYVNGQRLKYANPFRFFLSVSIIYFLMEGLIGFINPSDQSNAIKIKPSISQNDSIAKVLDKNLAEHPDDENLKKASTYFKNNPKFLDSISQEDKKITPYHSEEQLDTMSFWSSYNYRNSMYMDFYSEKKIENSQIALDSLKHSNTSMNRWLYSRAVAIIKIKDNPSGFMTFIMAKIPFFLFFFTPFYALFFWLIYSRKKFTYMEHVIFIFHIFSFVFLAMLIMRLPDAVFGIKFFQGILFAILGPLYFYKAMRYFYGQKRLVTLLKFVFLNIIFFMGFTIATILFVAAIAAIY